MLYILDYGAGNVASLANSVRSLGVEFKWVESVEDIEKADKILFPGVGNFGSALASLRSKGFAEPLKKYIASGRPYMGICIGMQALFLSSDESSELGLGVVPAHVGIFDNSDKAVPCMGWNGASLVGEGNEYGLDSDSSYYFVHSFRVKYDEKVEDWALTLTKYGDEVYVSSIQKGNVFATQFHPEKSGKAGLDVLRRWLEADGKLDMSKSVARAMEAVQADLVRKPFTKRIVACLDVRTNDAGDLVVTKGDQYDVRESEPSPAPSPLVSPAPASFPSTSATANDESTPPSFDPPSNP
ncbi:hypothetical protein P7C70_g9017, partial [Phenoliferia sp. Uapishka_3]